MSSDDAVERSMKNPDCRFSETNEIFVSICVHQRPVRSSDRLRKFSVRPITFLTTYLLRYCFSRS